MEVKAVAPVLRGIRPLLRVGMNGERSGSEMMRKTMNKELTKRRNDVPSQMYSMLFTGI
jgi:hypothetical protein